MVKWLYDPSISLEEDRIEGDNLYIKGHSYPIKGVPYQESIERADIAKKILTYTLKNFWFILPFKNRNKYLHSLNKLISNALPTKETLQTPVQEIQTFLFHFLKHFIDARIAERTARLTAHLFEYDLAYRYRVQDLSHETTKERLIAAPRKEIQRLIQIYLSRENKHQQKKAKYLPYLAYILTLPKYKKAFTNAIEHITIPNLHLDEGDRYWCRMRTDYDFKNAYN